MARCPEIDALEQLLERDDKRVIKHASRCLACQAVLALFADRGVQVELPECATFELLATKRELGALTSAESETLDRHARDCESCRMLMVDELPDG